MPRQRRSRFTRRKANALPGRPVAKKPCCVVCYNDFTPYPLTCNSWEASMGKVFYKVLNIPSSQTNGDMDMDEETSNEDEEDDSIISLPFCPQCHSKVSVMFSLYNQLQFLQEQFCSVRNDVAFTVVETISKNCRNGPMDYIRQQICQQWQMAYNEAKGRDDMGLGSTIVDQGSDDIYHSQRNNDSNAMALPVSMKIPGNPNVVAIENALLKISKGPSLLTTKPSLADAEEAAFLNSVPKRRPASPIPAMPKLIPMAVLQAEAQRNRNKQSDAQMKGKIKKLVGARDKISPDISPASPNGCVERNVTPVLHNRGVKARTSKGRGLTGGRPQVNVQRGNWKKTDNKESKLESSDESFEGLTTKDIILKQNSLPVSEEEELHQCKLCPRQYSTPSRLMRHESLCHPMLKALRCHLCPKGFSSALTLRRHMQNIHHSAIEGYTMCPLCDRSFIKKYAFEVHLRGHEKQGLVVPPLSPSEMPPLPTGGRSHTKPTNRKNIKRTGSNKLDGKPSLKSHKGYSHPQTVSRSKSSRTLTMSARAKAASKFVSHHVPTARTVTAGKTLVSNSIIKTMPKTHKLVPKASNSMVPVSSKERSGGTVAGKRKGNMSYPQTKITSRSKRMKTSAMDEEEIEDEDSEDPGVVEDSDSDYDP